MNKDTEAFSSEENSEYEIKKSIKIDNKKSKFQNKSKSKEDFNSRVKEVVGEKEERNKKAFELGQKFISHISDKTLQVNKGPIQKDLEKQTCSDLFLLSSTLNNDPSEPEGAGSLVLDTLFIKSFLIMRDRINELEYANLQLQKRIQELESK